MKKSQNVGTKSTFTPKNKKLSTEEEEKERGRFWNQVESRDKKRRGWRYMGIHVWWRKKKKKKKRTRMDERKEKNKK